MTRLAGTSGAALLALLAGCAPRPSPVGPRGPAPSEFSELEVNRVITTALEAEAAGLRVDSLYAANALVVVNGRTRPGPPLYAGIAPGGLVAVTSSQMEVRQGLAWGLVDYRWESAGDNLVREGRATLVVALQQDGRWRITHAHSSSPR